MKFVTTHYRLKAWLLSAGLLLVLPCQGASLILTQAHGGGGAAWGLDQCAACHPLRFIHRQAPEVRDQVRRVGYDSCAGCHGNNGTRAVRRCAICHNANQLPEMPALDGNHSHDFSGGGQGLDDERCLICHQASDMDGEFEPEQDLSWLPDRWGKLTPVPSISAFCLRCHNRDHQLPGFEMSVEDYRDPLVAMEQNYLSVDFHGWRQGSGERSFRGLRPGYSYPDLVACTDCHAMHGTDNNALIIDRSSKGVSRLDPLFRAVDWRVDTRDGNFAQLCVLCHEMEVLTEQAELDTGNGLGGVHQARGDCRSCHSHGLAAQSGL